MTIKVRRISCTGLTARWCAIHGDCTCSSSPEDDMDELTCPLHALTSTHPRAHARVMA